ncbi:hypothetical protein BJV82DRAFT_164542 [Fennellomyces sp. T-0311]|nr:hypothetical protein BJV82DRAFT_164542 [Fennellomyces sp. T-0311]
MSGSETECRILPKNNGKKSKTKEKKSKKSKGNDSEIEEALKFKREKEARRAEREEKEKRQAKRERTEARRAKRERKEARRTQKETDVAQQRADDKSAKDMIAIQDKQDRPIITNVTTNQELVPVCHPMLPITLSPKYFVNKDSIVSSLATGKFKPSIPTKGTNGCRYAFQVDKTHVVSFKLEEIMAYTFSEHFDRTKHYIFHKDGNQGNCAWSNLIVCDLPTLQKHEIARLETLYPDTKYTVVRNVHDTLTFERYLVSDTGKIYSLSRRNHLHLGKDDFGYLQTGLTADINATQTATRRLMLRVHGIVIQSFTQRRPKGHHVTHINGDKCDNFLKNLAYADPKKNQRRHGERRHKAPPPLPPVTDKTQWKIIGVLPWNGLSFSQHEVSNMGHVRKKDDPQILKLSYTTNKYACIHLRHDNQDLKTHPKVLTVSRLVANAFVDGYSEAHTIVKHLNGIRLDDRAQNLKWISRDSTLKQKNARRIVASLVENPEVRKEFPSLRKAQLELSAYTFGGAIVKYGNSFTKAVNWDGERKMALIQVVSSEDDKE